MNANKRKREEKKKREKEDGKMTVITLNLIGFVTLNANNRFINTSSCDSVISESYVLNSLVFFCEIIFKSSNEYLKI